MNERVTGRGQVTGANERALLRGHILRGHIFIDKPSPTFNCTRRAEFATRPAG
jgi:hypothetical protein